MAITYIGIGSNLGDRNTNIHRAIEKLKQHSGVRALRTSSIYETDPVGFLEQGNFLNAVLEVETDMSAEALLAYCNEIEDDLGRVRRRKSGPRTIDLDILFYDAQVIQKERLIVPHPRLHERTFILRGLAELAPGFIHPLLNMTVAALKEKREGH